MLVKINFTYFFWFMHNKKLKINFICFTINAELSKRSGGLQHLLINAKREGTTKKVQESLLKGVAIYLGCLYQ